MPHVYCLRDPGLIALHAVSDAVIALSYFLIPAALWILLRRRRDIAVSWMFGLFALFILGCGITHVLSVVTLWVPYYRLDGLLKAFTALVSIGTAIVLYQILPSLLLIPSPERLRLEITQRERAENQLKEANGNLEQRVADRTVELELANHRLAESELRIRNILDGASAFISVKDLTGSFSFVNQALLEHIGLPRDQVLGRTNADLFAPALAAEYSSNDLLAMESGPRQFEETSFNSGRTLTYLSNKFPLTGLDGRPYGICGISTDITERKSAEQSLARANQELRESEERFRRMAELIPDMLWSAGVDGQVRFISRRYQCYTGLLKPQFSGSGWTAIFHPEDLPLARETMAKSLLTKQSWSFEARLRRTDGTFRWFLSRTIPVCDESGQVEHWLGSFTDIDESKRTEQALRRSNEELEQFAYAAAHDLQEPLRNISTSLGMLRRQLATSLQPFETDWIDESVRSAIRMQEMVKDLLLYSRVVSECEGEPPAIDAACAAQQALNNLNGAISETGAQVRTGQLPLLPVRESHLIMLFQNLLGNAMKYRKAHEPPVIEVSATPRGNEWQFEVSDNGIGFDPSYSERIFKVFKRLHSRDQYSGNGIGLAVCARIVAHYGGRIWAEGQLGKGATFRFTLPAQ